MDRPEFLRAVLHYYLSPHSLGHEAYRDSLRLFLDIIRMGFCSSCGLPIIVYDRSWGLAVGISRIYAGATMAVSAISSFGSAKFVRQIVSHLINCDKSSYGSSLLSWLVVYQRSQRLTACISRSCSNDCIPNLHFRFTSHSASPGPFF